ncbi:MAG TPA: histone deacetylase family protein, partial [Actinomycetota bacterium]|nr:histone deacetylase family protein [Actinomycetota bacterium]
PTAVVLSLGVDAAADDPESPLRVTAAGYQHAGQHVAGLGVPVVAVQEGGYRLPTLGGLVVAALEGLSG